MTALDAPIWSALTGAHAALACGGELAKRYEPEVTPLAALREQSAEAYAELAALMSPEDTAILFLSEEPRPPSGWIFGRRISMNQMVCATPPPAPPESLELAPLGPADVPEMLALAKVTLPGPFRRRTIELGGYLGVRAQGRLAAMAGHRIRPEGHVEISGVCTHPDFQGRGLAKALVARLTRDAFETGLMPMLGVRDDNAPALGLYERLGFSTRRVQKVVALKRPR